MTNMRRAVRPQDVAGTTSFEHPPRRKGGGGIPGRDPIDRFFEKYTEDKKTGCWLWTGALNSRGYGCFGWGGKGKSMLAHRWAWIHLAGKKIPAGKVVSHTDKCGKHHCVNPDHMLLKDPEKAKRSGDSPVAANAQATHCAYGHPFSGDNLRTRADGRRICRTCDQRRNREGDERQRERRIKAGLCPKCGKRPPEKDYTRCAVCREANKLYMRKYNKERS
jgi:HNH endonuclease